jgi:methyl-accepting chemotaxis protein
LNKLRAANDKLNAFTEQLISLVLAGKEDQAVAFMYSEATPLAQEVVEAISKIQEMEVSLANDKSYKNKVMADTTARTMLVLLCSGLFLAIGLGIFHHSRHHRSPGNGGKHGGTDCCP